MTGVRYLITFWIDIINTGISFSRECVLKTPDFTLVKSPRKLYIKKNIITLKYWNQRIFSILFFISLLILIFLWLSAGYRVTWLYVSQRIIHWADSGFHSKHWFDQETWKTTEWFNDSPNKEISWKKIHFRDERVIESFAHHLKHGFI